MRIEFLSRTDLFFQIEGSNLRILKITILPFGSCPGAQLFQLLPVAVDRVSPFWC